MTKTEEVRRFGGKFETLTRNCSRTFALGGQRIGSILEMIAWPPGRVSLLEELWCGAWSHPCASMAMAQNPQRLRSRDEDCPTMPVGPDGVGIESLMRWLSWKS